MAVSAIPVAAGRQILHSCRYLWSPDYHLEPPAGFCIDFASWKPALKVTNGIHMYIGCCNVIIASWLPSSQIAIMWLQGYCNGHNYENPSQVPFVQDHHSFELSLNEWMLSKDYQYIAKQSKSMNLCMSGEGKYIVNILRWADSGKR